MSPNQDRGGLTRRALLSAGGAVLAASTLAGCTNSTSGTSSGSSSSQDSPPSSTSTAAVSSSTTSGSNSPYLIDHDTVVVTPSGNEAPCSLQNRFLHGQKLTFRVKVVDGQTGNELTGKDLKGVTIDIQNGSAPTLPMKFMAHPNPKHPLDHYWVVPWTVPKGFPTGPVNYSIEVSGSHSTKTVSFDLPPSSLTVLKGTYTPPKTSSKNSTS